MNFYNNMHPYYCGIDLHARMLYVCIIDQDGNILFHKEIADDPDKLFQILEPYIGNIVVGVECMHCWYWVSDFCLEFDTRSNCRLKLAIFVRFSAQKVTVLDCQIDCVCYEPTRLTFCNA